ncbi:MAG: M4 family metallopeptidase [Rhodospirillales bacterium]|nr:M4 family metallopeptidase [Rhodospirillales bacterium]
MTFHKCNCHYIPPHVLGNMAKKGDPAVRQAARTSAQQAKLSREKRGVQAPKVPEMLTGIAMATAPAPVTAAREVYDCQNKWELRVKLARGEGDPEFGDDDVDTVYGYAETVRGYFAELGRNSIDNAGMNLRLNVHVGENYMNAFWDGDEMAFGDGDGQIFTSFAQSLDVMAHEMAHGVTQFTANLDYYSQSGALNEHFSDVFGTAITQYKLNQTVDDADWLIGNEIMGPTLYGEALRSMKAPGTAYDNPLLGKDPQPAHMKDYYNGPNDNRGVHINSGIMNRAFYLAATDQIGTQKAAKIWYHALQNLWPTADFDDAVEIIVESARTLVGDGVVPEGTTQTVRLAFKEVGLPS